MTNRTVDADALLEWCNAEKFDLESFWGVEPEYNINYEYLIAKINELAVPAPHEISIKSNLNGFEFKTGDVCKFVNPHIEGRNEEFIILNFYSYYENDFQYVSVYGLSSKEQFNTNIALIKKNEPQDSLKSLLEWIEAQEEFEGRDAIDIDDLKEVVSKITAPQQSIFDADEWNANFKEAPQDYDTPILIKYYCDWKKCERITVGHYEEVLGEPDYTGFYTWYETGCIGENKLIKNLISWKLLPTGGNHE